MLNEGRKELAMERFEHLARQVKFAKSRDGIVKKAAELAELCNVDVGLLMFSSAGRLTSFASNGRSIFKSPCSSHILCSCFNSISCISGLHFLFISLFKDRGCFSPLF